MRKLKGKRLGPKDKPKLGLCLFLGFFGWLLGVVGGGSVSFCVLPRIRCGSWGANVLLVFCKFLH